MSTNKPTTADEHNLRARRLAHDIACSVVDVLIEKDEHPSVVSFAISIVSGRIMLIAMDSQGHFTERQDDFRADLKEVPKRIERGEQPK